MGLVFVWDSRARILMNQEDIGSNILMVAIVGIHEPVILSLSHVQGLCRVRIIDAITIDIPPLAAADALTIHSGHEDILIFLRAL
jgi:hypothetical protein